VAKNRVYSTLFGAPAAVVKPGNGKWTLGDPRLQLRDWQPGCNA
jgi:hypothetical protein